MMRIRGAAAGLIGFALLAGCGGEEPQTVIQTVRDETPQVVAVIVTTKSAYAAPGSTLTLSAVAVGINGASTAVKWSINDTPFGCSIDENSGALTVTHDAVLGEEITITARSAVQPEKDDTATVTISSAASVHSIAVDDSVVTVRKGDTRPFSATITGENGPLSTQVIWTVVNSTCSTFNGTNILSVGQGETETLLTIRATVAADNRVSGQAVARVPAVTEVRVFPDTATVKKGGTAQFYAAVGGFALEDLEAADKAVTWSVSPQNGSTAINGDGLLFVDSHETETALTVTAISAYDSVAGAAAASVSDVPIAFAGVDVFNTFGTTTKLVLYFSGSIAGLEAADIAITDTENTGIQRGTFLAVDGTNGVYELAVSGVRKSGTILITAAEKPGYTITGNPQTVPVTYGNIASLKTKFNVATEGKAGVTATFTALSAFIQSGGLTSQPDFVRLGDYIDLEELAVGAYGDVIDTIALTNTPVTPASVPYPAYAGRRLRLILVGINSFQARDGYSYAPPAESDHAATPHVVFQFQNLLTRRMHSSATNASGYLGTEMRAYLAGANGNNGTFLAGLLSAGVPGDALWAPTRLIANKGYSLSTGLDVIKDTVWIPSEFEMMGAVTYAETRETAANQARLEYYDNNAKRIKYLFDGTDISKWYWTGSPSRTSSEYFCVLGSGGNIDSGGKASVPGCFAPAFCVK
jgi:hypothetical protein